MFYEFARHVCVCRWFISLLTVVLIIFGNTHCWIHHRIDKAVANRTLEILCSKFIFVKFS